MPHTRKQDQTVDAFSAPKDLIKLAKRRAADMKMSKSGFFRYCLAKELGYSEDEARDLAEHNTIQRLREEVSGKRYPEHRPSAHILNEPNSSEEGVLKENVEAALAERMGKAGHRPPKGKA